MSMDETLAAALEQRQRDQLYRRRYQLESAQGAEVLLDGARYLNFSSNDYLGLANHPKLIEASQQAVARLGTGSGASHLVNGHSCEHHALEEELAEFTGRQRALLFSTGYMANLGTVTALVGRGDAVFEDKLNHASLLDAGLLSGARFQRFLHNDVASLKSRLEASDAERKLMVVDGVFSMDGDIAPLPELSRLAQEHNAWLMADDAHGFGCLGETGAGSAEYFQLNSEQLPVLMGTLGKALGSFGAFVAGSEALVETLIQFARPYIYTTAMPPAQAAVSRAALRLLGEERWRRQRLDELIQYFRQGASQLGLPLMASTTAIQPLLLSEPGRVMRWAASLREAGFLVGAIRPPTVPAGSARLRITLSAAHNEAQIDRLLQALENCLKLEGCLKHEAREEGEDD